MTYYWLVSKHTKNFNTVNLSALIVLKLAMKTSNNFWFEQSWEVDQITLIFISIIGSRNARLFDSRIILMAPPK
ncbi:hypothetical protein APQ14_08950 [Vibrio toranzoniae]|uniref:Uncharacterized protein n=1 Tax=Vibrio toranzoniae TaxID=1194427 RepID=A0A109D837_9VIBR|nr:hypothetical protein APQ14_08950 [Vibrio toranzoniae]